MTQFQTLAPAFQATIALEGEVSALINGFNRRASEGRRQPIGKRLSKMGRRARG